jgi:hypothetical protein
VAVTVGILLTRSRVNGCAGARPTTQFLGEVWVNERASGVNVRQPLVVNGYGGWI